MSAAPPGVGLGLRAQRGGAVLVGVILDAGEPRVLLSTWLPTHKEGDRLAREPYHVAYEIAQSDTLDKAAAVVAEGRQRQDRLAAEGLQGIVDRLDEAGHGPVIAALLVNRAGWVTDLLEYSLAFPDHPPVAEGLAVREALRFALRHRRIEAIELDEKSLIDRAPEALGMPLAEVEASLRAVGATAGKPWRKEQKLACLAAWIALAERG
jgi:hypothetical protein